jgi:predicted nuclease of predicted toxin-antitoxin system
MRPLRFPLLADENIHPGVIAWLVSAGRRVLTCHSQRLAGSSDRQVLRRARELGAVVLTHDADFGALAVLEEEPFIGIIYLRPGHIQPKFVLEILEAIDSRVGAVRPPFVLVAERKHRTIRIRLRRGLAPRG